MNAPVRTARALTAEQRSFRDRAAPALRAIVGDNAYEAWLMRLELVRVDEAAAELSTPTIFIASWARRNYEAQVLEALRICWPSVDRVIFVPRKASAHVRPLPAPAPVLEPPSPPVAELPSRAAEIVFARAALRPDRILIGDIIGTVASHYGVAIRDLLSSRRTADIVRPRQIAMFLAKELTQRSFPEIGRRIGGRDHTTALHGFVRIREMAAEDANLASDLQTIRTKLREAVMSSSPRELPTRRNAPTIDFELFDGYACQGYSAQYAEFADGGLAEVFLVPAGGPNARVGMPLDTMAKDLSVLFSIARRYGAPVDVIRAALSQQADGQMLGPLGEFLRLHAEGGGGDEPDPAPAIPQPQPAPRGGGALERVPA